MYLPLSRSIPLRDTTAWGRFASIQAIPRVYGRATIAPVPYDDSGRLFVAADHPIQAVVSVAADNAPVTAWRCIHRPDATGKTVAFLELQTAITIGTTKLAAMVEGLRDPLTGLLMTNPADVVWDALQWGTGQSIDRDRFARFRSSCHRAGMEVHGALADGSQTLRAALDAIMDSACAAWGSSAPDFGLVLL